MARPNPYADFGGTVTETRFIGREAELRTIASRVFGAGGYGSIAIIGLPRVGKSSLVSEAIRRADARSGALRTVVVRANVGEFASIGELFRRLIEDLAEGIESQSLGNHEIDRRMNQALALEVLDFGAVRSVFRSLRRAEVRPVCVLDEFDAGRRLFNETPQCFHWLRELCSTPAFKAALVIIAKRRLQEVARLAGHESDYWANVLMTLALKPFLDNEVTRFFTALETRGVALRAVDREEVLALCGGNPYLLDGFAFHAWERADQGDRIDSEWIRAIGGELHELGVLREEQGELRGFLRTFEGHLRLVARDIDIWPLWRDTERALRDVLERHLSLVYGPDWPDRLVKSRPRLGSRIEDWRKNRERERSLFGRASSLLAYTYPMDLYALMVSDWPHFGEPLLGRNKQDWSTNFKVLAKVRTPLAHNREEAVTEADRLQAEGICRAILERYEQWKSADDLPGHADE